MRKMLPLLAALALTGCNKASAPDDAADADAVQTDTLVMAPIRYACADGTTVEATYPTTETAQIVHQGKTIDMTIAVSADGARYVGGGWEWWTKGMTDGTLSPLKPGEEIASEPGTICAAPE